MSRNNIEKFGCYGIAAIVGPLDLPPPSSKSSNTPSNSSSHRLGGPSTPLAVINPLLNYQSPPRNATNRNSKIVQNSSSFSPISPFSAKFSLHSRYNDSLIDLNLAGNAIGPQGAQYLAAALMQNYTLQQLDVSYQQTGKKIGPDGATYFAGMLRFADMLVKI